MSPTGKPIIDEVILKDIGTETALVLMSRYYEEVEDDLQEGERMAEAMYEC